MAETTPSDFWSPDLSDSRDHIANTAHMQETVHDVLEPLNAPALPAFNMFQVSYAVIDATGSPQINFPPGKFSTPPTVLLGFSANWLSIIQSQTYVIRMGTPTTTHVPVTVHGVNNARELGYVDCLAIEVLP